MNVDNAQQEAQVNAAFSRQSPGFDALEEHNVIIHRIRTRVRTHVLTLLKPGASILELNAGTGIDSLFFAQQGFTVHATDNADCAACWQYLAKKYNNKACRIKCR